jgi:GTP-binding protein HflX
MVERSRSGERAVLVHLDVKELAAGGEGQDLREFQDLVNSTGAETAAVVTGARKAPDPQYFVGSGKAEEVCDQVAATGAQLAIFDHALSPSQERNLEKLIQCRVLDRTGLILDIFARRARSFEGKLQVELAQLNHMSTRLVRGWSHLERQRGGIGLRGPGETQLETDRRLIGNRIKQIHKRLDKVRKRRSQNRRARKKATVPTISLVGYTNAGKSTLFNALTDADTFADNRLFATLDPTLRQIELPHGIKAVLSDTVGFVADLPTTLVAAFRATLEEVTEADLILHVRDIAHPDTEAQARDVAAVLAELGIDIGERDRVIEVWNKIDLLPGAVPRSTNSEGPQVVTLSALTGEGIDELVNAIEQRLSAGRQIFEIALEGAGLADLHRLYELGEVVSRVDTPDGATVASIRVPAENLDRFRRSFPKARAAN